jgi:hypothetical protein
MLRRDTITNWRPNDEHFWETRGKALARRLRAGEGAPSRPPDQRPSQAPRSGDVIFGYRRSRSGARAPEVDDAELAELVDAAVLKIAGASP